MKIEDYVLEYIEDKGISYQSDAEYKQVKEGILLFLKDHGIKPEEEKKYFIHVVGEYLKHIKDEDLKEYFKNYEKISECNHYLIRSRDGISDDEIIILTELVTSLLGSPIGTRYIAIDEIRKIIGDRS